MNKIKVFSRVFKSDGRTCASVRDFETIEEATAFVEREPGQRWITFGDAEFQLGLQLLGAERGE